MKPIKKCCIAIGSFITFIGCKSVAQFTIDKEPVIKIDTNLLGIWKAVEDTDKANYILVQNYDDLYRLAQTRENEDIYNHHCYYITYMSNHGINPRYAQFRCFLSTAKGSSLLNIRYNYVPFNEQTQSYGTLEQGYFFVRLITSDYTHGLLTTALFKDTTIGKLRSSKEVRRRITNNINNPLFYSDTLHFRKVSNYHYSLNESKTKAN